MKRSLAIVLAVVALLLLAAHFYRAGSPPLAICAFALIVLVFVSGPWGGRLLRVALLLGALEWVRTAWMLAAHRIAAGQPYLRMIAILGAVAVVTAIAAFLAGHLGNGSDGDRGRL